MRTTVSSSQQSQLPPFQALLDAHGATVLRVVTAIVGRDDAADVWQETFTKAWVAYPRLSAKPPASQAGDGPAPALRADEPSADVNAVVDDIRPWLLTIARNAAIDVLRARAKRPIPTDEVTDLPVEPPAGYDDALWLRVNALPPKQRLAVIYRYVGDLAYADVATLLDCSTDAARRSAHEGVRRLRTELNDDH